MAGSFCDRLPVRPEADITFCTGDSYLLTAAVPYRPCVRQYAISQVLSYSIVSGEVLCGKYPTAPLP